jgi:hypothetical protein
MPRTGSIFKNMSKSYFLYYSWIELKILYCLSIELGYKPISFTWFLKASRLLRGGLFLYPHTKLVKFRREKFSLIDLRYKVIECATFNAIYPYFCIYFLRKKNAILYTMRIKFIF